MHKHQKKKKKFKLKLFPFPLVELLDPRWKEQRAKSDQRQSLTNLSTSDVAANLKRLRSQRSDVFEGPTTSSLPSSTSATIPPGIDQSESSEQARKKLRAAGPTNNGLPILPLPPVSSMGGGKDGGGGSGGGGMQGLNIEEQIRQIHQKFKSPT